MRSISSPIGISVTIGDGQAASRLLRLRLEHHCCIILLAMNLQVV